MKIRYISKDLQFRYVIYDDGTHAIEAFNRFNTPKWTEISRDVEEKVYTQFHQILTYVCVK